MTEITRSEGAQKVRDFRKIAAAFTAEETEITNILLSEVRKHTPRGFQLDIVNMAIGLSSLIRIGSCQIRGTAKADDYDHNWGSHDEMRHDLDVTIEPLCTGLMPFGITATIEATDFAMESFTIRLTFPEPKD